MGARSTDTVEEDEIWVQWINIGISEDSARTDPKLSAPKLLYLGRRKAKLACSHGSAEHHLMHIARY
jgi:hypothetical protein